MGKSFGEQCFEFNKWMQVSSLLSGQVFRGIDFSLSNGKVFWRCEVT